MIRIINTARWATIASFVLLYLFLAGHVFAQMGSGGMVTAPEAATNQPTAAGDVKIYTGTPNTYRWEDLDNVHDLLPLSNSLVAADSALSNSLVAADSALSNSLVAADSALSNSVAVLGESNTFAEDTIFKGDLVLGTNFYFYSEAEIGVTDDGLVTSGQKHHNQTFVVPAGVNAMTSCVARLQGWSSAVNFRLYRGTFPSATETLFSDVGVSPPWDIDSNEWRGFVFDPPITVVPGETLWLNIYQGSGVVDWYYKDDETVFTDVEAFVFSTGPQAYDLAMSNGFAQIDHVPRIISTNDLEVIVGGTEMVINVDGKDKAKFTANAVELLPSVGIGTASPSEMLEVASNGTAVVKITGGESSGNPQLTMSDGESGGVDWRIVNGEEGDGIFSIAHGTGDTALHIKTNAAGARVGINKDNSSAVLCVKSESSSDEDVIVVRSDSDYTDSVSLGTTGTDGVMTMRNQSGDDRLRLVGEYGALSWIWSDLAVGPIKTPSAQLHVINESGDTGDAFLVWDQNSDSTPFVIDDEGNVGVGDPTPDDALDVVGDIEATVDVTAGQDVYAGRLVRVNEIGYIRDDGANALVIQGGTAGTKINNNANNVVNVMVEDGGNVGIGTATPAYPLDVVGDAAFEVSTAREIRFTDVATIAEIRAIDSTGATYQDLRVTGSKIDLTEDGTPVLTVDGGNVGIGTASPNELLEVNKSQDALTSIEIENSNAGSGAAASVKLTSNGGNAFIYRASDAYGSVADDLVLQDSGGGDIVMYGAAEVARFANGGNVGIGTATPLSKLHVVDSTAVGIRLANNETAATDKYGYLIGSQQDSATETEGSFVIGSANQSGANNVWIGGGSSAVNASTAIKFWTAANHTTRSGTQRMVIDSSGNVGIGTASPSTLLHMNSSDNASYPLLVAADIDADGAYSGISFGLTGSDAYQKARIHVEGTSGYVQPDMHFLLESTADSSNADLADAKLSVLNNGKVGIGINNPTDADLHVKAASGDEHELLVGLSAAGGAKLWYDNGSGFSYLDNMIDNASYGLQFRVRANGTPVTGITIGGDGKVTLVSGTGVNEFSTDGTLAGDSDDAVPTEKAVKTYVDAAVASTAVYGEMKVAAQAVTINTINVWEEVGGFTAGNINGMAVASGNIDPDTGNDGTYQVMASVSSTAGAGGAKTFEWAISINDTIDTDSIISRRYSATDVGAFAVSGVISLSAGDLVTLEVRNIDNADNITVDYCNFMLHKID